MRSIACCLATALLATAMVGSAVPQQPLGVPFDLAVGQSETVGDEGLRVGLDEVPLDSRCPLGFFCIWEGDAVAAMWAERPLHSRGNFKLHSSPMFEQHAKYEGYKIFLMYVSPYPVGDVVIDPSDYVVTVLVAKTTVPVEDTTWGRIKSIYNTESSDN